MDRTLRARSGLLATVRLYAREMVQAPPPIPPRPPLSSISLRNHNHRNTGEAMHQDTRTPPKTRPRRSLPDDRHPLAVYRAVRPPNSIIPRETRCRTRGTPNRHSGGSLKNPLKKETQTMPERMKKLGQRSAWIAIGAAVIKLLEAVIDNWPF